MLDFLHKELVDQYYWSNIGYDNVSEKRVLINGREYFAECSKPYVVAAVLVWKVPVLSSKQFKYAVHIGVSQRSQLCPDCYIDFPEILEKAVEKAYVDPTMTLVIDNIDEIECLYEQLIPAFADHVTDGKMSLTTEEVENVIKTNFKDSYSQKYPLDLVNFKLVKPAI